MTKTSETQALSTLERLENDYFLHYVKRNLLKNHPSINPLEPLSPGESNQRLFRRLDPIRLNSEEIPLKLHSKVNKSLHQPKKISLTKKNSPLTSLDPPETLLKSKIKNKEAIFPQNFFKFQENFAKTPNSRFRIKAKKLPDASSSSQETESLKVASSKNIPFLKPRRFSSKSRYLARINPKKRLSRVLRSFSLERLKTFKDFHLIKLFNY
jgi:hypothetical protein